MGKLQTIVQNHDIMSDAGFSSAIEEARTVSEGELHFVAGYDPGPQSKPFQHMIALAKAELGRREAAEQRKLVWISAASGLTGVIVGAILTAVLT